MVGWVKLGSRENRRAALVRGISYRTGREHLASGIKVWHQVMCHLSWLSKAEPEKGTYVQVLYLGGAPKEPG